MATGEDRGRLIALLKRDALRTGTFTLASGRSSHYYVDGRTVTLSAEGAALIGSGVLGLIADLPAVKAIGGLTMGADPIVGAALAVAGAGARPGLLGFLVRKEAKGHGTGKLVEGPASSRDGRGDRRGRHHHRGLRPPGRRRRRGRSAAGSPGSSPSWTASKGPGQAFAARGLDFRALVTIRDLGVEPLPPA